MNRTTLLYTFAASLLCLGIGSSANASQPAAASTAPESQKCLKDLSAFNSHIQKDGYWLGSSGYGYPMDGAAYVGPTAGPMPGYPNARSGYEVRTLMASANILARHGQQQACETVLSTTRTIYSSYVTDMRNGHVAPADVSGWEGRQIRAAQPIADKATAVRSDELLGTEIRTPQNTGIGSVDDIVMSPKTGKIAYLVIARGGIFGIGEHYVPVPWENFKITPDGTLLVLNTTADTLDHAPTVKSDQFAPKGNFDQESQKVDAYWKTHLSANE